VATVNSVLYAGANPVFVDIESLDEPHIGCTDAAAKCTARTKAVVVMHYAGYLVDYDIWRHFARTRGLHLIEDAAHAAGLDRPAGFGDAAVFSFFGNKNMTTGEGGMVTTDDDAIAEKVSVLRQHGATHRYRHDTLGYNFRLTDMAAAIGRAQLAKLDRFNERRRRNASLLDEGLAGTEGLTMPRERPGYRHVYHQYTVRVARDRDRFQERLRGAGIGTAVHYPIPVHRQPLYLEMGYGQASLPVAEKAAAQVLSLPVHPALSDADLDRIVDAVRKVATTA
jgi:perosamine synthetase